MLQPITNRSSYLLRFVIYGVRTAPVAIHGPPGTRIRNIGLVHEEGTPDSVPEKEASPCALSVTGELSITVGELLAPQTSAPATLVTGPGVPLEFPPLITRPSTANVTAPVVRSTNAKPLLAVHGDVPLAMPPTGFEVPGAVITPVIVLQNTTVLLLLVWATSVAVAIRDSNTTANAFFIGLLPRFRKVQILGCACAAHKFVGIYESESSEGVEVAIQKVKLAKNEEY
jgi:hypothetical protein